MIFKVKPKPKEWDTRLKKKFALFPKRMSVEDTVVWLCFYYSAETRFTSFWLSEHTFYNKLNFDYEKYVAKNFDIQSIHSRKVIYV